MRKGRTKLSLYRRVRNALLATNKRTDNSIITECNIVEPLANDKGTPVAEKGYTRKRGTTRTRFNKIGRKRNY